MNKRGVSPVIATVLLITIVIILAAIIFLWARGFVQEQAQKFGGAVELACEQVKMEAAYISGEVDVVNRGNVPLYGIEIKKRRTGSVLVNEIEGSTVGVGQSLTIDLASSGVTVQSGDELNVVPIILGETDSGKVAHVCGDQFGYALVI